MVNTWILSCKKQERMPIKGYLMVNSNVIYSIWMAHKNSQMLSNEK